MPLIHTGYEPSGDNWQFVDDRIIAQVPSGTMVVAEYTDATLLSIAGIDLWGSISIDDIEWQIWQQGKQCLYVSRWRDPGAFVFGTYRVCIVRVA